MFVDEAGALWLSNPWIVLVTLAAAIAAVVWCHRWLETGRAPMPKNVATHWQPRRRLTHAQALRTNRVGSLSMDAPVIQFSHSGRSALRTRRPSSAA
jgi:hypothetical protein